jgi:quercetin dioxygenase-like cupin family protein
MTSARSNTGASTPEISLELARNMLARLGKNATNEELQALANVESVWESIEPLSSEPGFVEESLRIFRLLRSSIPYSRFAPLLAAALDIDLEVALAQLAEIDSAASWEPSPFAGVELYHVSGGPDVADAITGYVRIAPETVFPHHEHAGDEYVVLLDGTLDAGDGTILHPGRVHSMPAGSAHAVCSGSNGATYLAIVHRGIVVDGHFLSADDPSI